MPPEPRPLAQILMRHFVGRTDAYALQQADGSYVAVRKPLTLEELERHVRGEITVATYLVTPEGKVRCGVYDFDEKTEEARYVLVCLGKWFEHWGIPFYIEPSGNKGYHGWVPLGEWVPAWKVIRVLRLALHQIEEETGITCRVEVFPKQAQVQDLGNCVKIPWGVHRKSGKRTALMNHNLEHQPDWGASLIRAMERPAEEVLDRILEEYPEAPSPTPGQEGAEPPGQGKGALPCFTRMLEGVKEGFRHIASFRLAVMLYRQGIDQQMAKAILLKWDAERNQPPWGRRRLATTSGTLIRASMAWGARTLRRQATAPRSAPSIASGWASGTGGW